MCTILKLCLDYLISGLVESRIMSMNQELHITCCKISRHNFQHPKMSDFAKNWGIVMIHRWSAKISENRRKFTILEYSLRKQRELIPKTRNSRILKIFRNLRKSWFSMNFDEFRWIVMIHRWSAKIEESCLVQALKIMMSCTSS